MQLSNALAVVTGGVSGLGFAVAKHLVAHGGKVALFDVNDDKGAAAVAELGDTNARYFRTDVTDEAGVAANVAAAKEFLGGLNVAVNCAGILGAGRVLGRDGAMKLSQFQTTVMVNLVGSFNVAKACAEQMQGNEAGIDGERGVIVNTASVAAYEGQIGQAGDQFTPMRQRPFLVQSVQVTAVMDVMGQPRSRAHGVIPRCGPVHGIENQEPFTQRHHRQTAPANLRVAITDVGDRRRPGPQAIVALPAHPFRQSAVQNRGGVN